MKIKALVTAVALAVSASAAYASDNVQINPDATGPDPVITVGSLDWATGNAQIRGLATDPTTGAPVVGDTFQVYAHSSLSAFLDPDGNGIGGLNLNNRAGGYEWTFVAGFTERVTSSSGTTGQAAFEVVPGAPENFFRIYYDPTPDSNALGGTGFDDGILVLSGNATTGNSTFTRTTPLGGCSPTGTTACPTAFENLDQFGVDNYPAIDSVRGTGGTILDGVVTYANPDFFLSAPSIVQLNFQSQQNLPYQQTNPSAAFYNQADADSQTGPSVPGATVANVGPINGATALECGLIGVTGCGTGNVLFQSDASTAFTLSRVPEPGSLALVALATGLAGVFVRRVKKS